jgi:hypothetical protein
MRDLIHRMLAPFVSYSTRHHIGRRVEGTDFRFVGAVLALGIGVLILYRYGYMLTR